MLEPISHSRQITHRWAARLAMACAIQICSATLSLGQTNQRTISVEGQDFFYTAFQARDGNDYGYFVESARWPKSQTGATVIYVCWENYGEEYVAEHSLVKDAVTATWQKYSAVEFRGWLRCSTRSAGIRIRVAEDGPHTKGLGKALDGKPDGMVLNFTFNTWSPSCKSSQAERLACIRSISVHEFGHALGFAHEQNRPDKPGECTQPAQGTNTGAVALTPYDPNSVMNYCNPKYNNDGLLSEWDRFALEKVYGAN